MSKLKTGCEFWDDCFTCPYSDCIAGRPGNLKRVKRQKLVWTSKKAGLSSREIAEELGVSLRTIERDLKEGGVESEIS